MLKKKKKIEKKVYVEREPFLNPLKDNQLSIESKVLELQMKIYESIKEGNSKKVLNNQYQLINSKEARYLAVKRVITNHGGKTPGVDGYVPNKLVEYEKLISRLYKVKSSNYFPKTVKRIYIPKNPPSTDSRPISIPSIFDRCLQALWNFALLPTQEATTDPNNYGFRPGRSCHDAMNFIRKNLAQANGPKYILEVDIKKFYDTIDHNFIMNKVMMNKGILYKWLKAGFMDDMKIVKIDNTGIPQGGIISPTICNLCLNGIQEFVLKNTKIEAKKVLKLKREDLTHTLYVRFADNMIVTSKNKQVLEIALNKIKEFLKIRGLEIKESKTRIIHLNENFNFLGFSFQYYPFIKPKKVNNKNFKEGYTFKSGNFVTSPKKENTNRIYKKCVTALYKYPNNQVLGIMLNSIIRGWVLYYGVTSFAKEKSRLTQN